MSDLFLAARNEQINENFIEKIKFHLLEEFDVQAFVDNEFELSLATLSLGLQNSSHSVQLEECLGYAFEFHQCDVYTTNLSQRGIAWLYGLMPAKEEALNKVLARTLYNYVNKEIPQEAEEISTQLLSRTVRRLAHRLHHLLEEEEWQYFPSEILDYCKIDFLMGENVYAQTRGAALRIFEHGIEFTDDVSVPGTPIDLYDHGHRWACELARNAFIHDYDPRKVIAGLSEMLYAMADHYDLDENSREAYRVSMVTSACLPFPSALAVLPWEISLDDAYPHPLAADADCANAPGFKASLRGPLEHMGSVLTGDNYARLFSAIGVKPLDEVGRALQAAPINSAVLAGLIEVSAGRVDEQTSQWMETRLDSLEPFEAYKIMRALNYDTISQGLTYAIEKTIARGVAMDSGKNYHLYLPFFKKAEGWKDRLIPFMIQNDILSPDTIKFFGLGGSDLKPFMRQMQNKTRRHVLGNDFGL